MKYKIDEYNNCTPICKFKTKIAIGSIACQKCKNHISQTSNKVVCNLENKEKTK